MAYDPFLNQPDVNRYDAYASTAPTNALATVRSGIAGRGNISPPATYDGALGYNAQTGEWALGSSVFKGDVNMVAEAASMALKGEGAKQQLPEGFVAVDHRRILSDIAQAVPESDWERLGVNALKAVGDLSSYVGAAMGNNDIGNPWENADYEHKLTEDWGSQKGYDEGGLESWTGFQNAVAVGGGQMIPALAVGAINPYAGIVTGIASAGGAQADAGYNQLKEALRTMSPEELADTPAYAELRKSMPHNDAIDEMLQTARFRGAIVGSIEGGIISVLGVRALRGLISKTPANSQLGKFLSGQELNAGKVVDRVKPYVNRAENVLGNNAFSRGIVRGGAGGLSEGVGAAVGDYAVNRGAMDVIGRDPSYTMGDAWQSFQEEAPLGIVAGLLSRGTGARRPRSDIDEVGNSQPNTDGVNPPPTAPPTGVTPAMAGLETPAFIRRNQTPPPNPPTGGVPTQGEFDFSTPQAPPVGTQGEFDFSTPQAPPVGTQGEFDFAQPTDPTDYANNGRPTINVPAGGFQYEAPPTDVSPNTPIDPLTQESEAVAQYFNESVIPLIRQREDASTRGQGSPNQIIEPATSLSGNQVIASIRGAEKNGLLSKEEADAGELAVNKLVGVAAPVVEPIGPAGRRVRGVSKRSAPAPVAPTAPEVAPAVGPAGKRARNAGKRRTAEPVDSGVAPAPVAADTPMTPEQAQTAAAVAEVVPTDQEGTASIEAQLQEQKKGRRKKVTVSNEDAKTPTVEKLLKKVKGRTAKTNTGVVVAETKEAAEDLQKKVDLGLLDDYEMAKELDYQIPKEESDGTAIVVETADGTAALHEELSRADLVEARVAELTKKFAKDRNSTESSPVISYALGSAGPAYVKQRRAKRVAAEKRAEATAKRQAAKEAERQGTEALNAANQKILDDAKAEQGKGKGKGKATVDKVKNKRTAPADSQVAAAMETAGVTKEAVTPTELTGLAKIRDVAVKGIEKITKNPKYIKKAKSISTPQEYFDLYEQVEGEPLSAPRRIAFEALFDKVMGTEGKKGVGKPLTSSQETNPSEKPSTPQTTSATGKQKNTTQKAEKSTRTSDPLFSRNTSGSMTAAELRRKLKTQLARLEKAGIVSVKVIEHVTQLPAHIYAKLGGGTAEGVYDPRTNTVYLIAGEISPARAEAVLAHEVIGHYGIENLLSPSDWAAVKADLNKLAKDPNYKWFFDKVKKDNPNASEAVLMREAVAQIAEYRSKSPIIRKIAKMLKDALRKLGFNFTENGIAEGLAPSVDVALRRSEAYVFGQEFEVVRRRVVSPLASVADIAKLKDTFGGMTLDRFATTFSKDIKQATKTLAQAYSIAEAYISDVKSYSGYGNNDFTPVATREKYDYEANLKMPDGSEYDPRNPKHANASDLTLAMAHADRDHYIGIIVDKLNALRGKTLSANAKLISSMVKQGKLSPPEGAMLIHGSARFNYTSKQGEGGIDVRVQEVQPNSQRATMVLSDRIIEAVVKELRSGKKFKDALGDGMTWLYNDGNFRQGRVGWFTYKKSDKLEDAQQLADGAVGREWCTTGLTSAAAQLKGGDFHIYYSEQGEPLIAMRTVNGRVSEVRGSLPQQELTPEEKAIAAKAIREGLADGKDYLHDQEIIEAVIGGFENVSNERLADMMVAVRKSESYFGFGFPPNVTVGIALEVEKRGIENIGVYDRLEIDASDMTIDEVNKRLATVYRANSLLITNARSGRYILPKAKDISFLKIYVDDNKVANVIAPNLEVLAQLSIYGASNFSARNLKRAGIVKYFLSNPIQVKFVGSGETTLSNFYVEEYNQVLPYHGSLTPTRIGHTSFSQKMFNRALQENKELPTEISVSGVDKTTVASVKTNKTSVEFDGAVRNVSVTGLFSSVVVPKESEVETARVVTSSQLHAVTITSASVEVVPSQQQALEYLHRDATAPYKWHSNIAFPLLENTKLLRIALIDDDYSLPTNRDVLEKAIDKGRYTADGKLPPEVRIFLPELSSIGTGIDFSVVKDAEDSGIKAVVIDTPSLYDATLLPYAPINVEDSRARTVDLRFSDNDFTDKVNAHKMLEFARGRLEFILAYTDLQRWLSNVRVRGLQNFNIPDNFNIVDDDNARVVALRVMATVAKMSNAELTRAIDGAISNNDKVRNLTTAEQDELSVNVGNTLVNMVKEFLEVYDKASLQEAVDLSVPLERENLYVPFVDIDGTAEAVEDTNFYDHFDPPDAPYNELMEGDFIPDERNDEPLFSRKAAEPSDFEPSEDVFKKMADALVDKVKLAGKTKIGATIFETLHSIATLRDQQDTYGTSPTNWGRAYNDLVKLLFTKNAFINNQLTKLAEQSRHYMALSADKKKALRELMLASQERSLNPMLALADHAWVSKSLRNHPDVIAAHKELVAMWKALGPDGQRAFKGLADENRRVAIAFIEARIGNYQQLRGRTPDEGGIEGELVDAKLKELKDELSQVKSGNINFSTQRAGDWLVVVPHNGKEGALVGEFKTEAEADAEVQNIKARTPYTKAEVIKVSKDLWEVRINEPTLRTFDSKREAEAGIKALREEIYADLLQTYKGDTAKADAAIRDMWESPSVDDPSVMIPKVVPKRRSDAYNEREFGAFAPAQVKRLNDLLRDKKITKVAYMTLMEDYLKSSDATSVTLSRLRRKLVRGAVADDMMTAYVTRYTSMVHALANASVSIKENQLRDQLESAELQNSYIAITGKDPVTAMNALARHEEATATMLKRSASNQFLQTVRGLTTFLNLALSPAYAIMNSTQPHVIGIPYLASKLINGYKVTYAEAAAAVNEAMFSPSAYKRLMDEIAAGVVADSKVIFNKKVTREQFSNDAVEDLVDKWAHGMNPRDKKAFMELVLGTKGTDGKRTGGLMEQDALALSYTDSIYDAMNVTKLGDSVKRFERMAMALGKLTEIGNRLTMARASFRLASERGMSGEALQSFVAEAIYRSQGDFSRTNRAAAFNNPWVGTALQFKTYVQLIYALFLRSANMALRGKTVAERREGRRMLSGMVTAHGLIGGLTGLGPITWMLKVIAVGVFGFGGSDDEDLDEFLSMDAQWRRGIREMLDDPAGEGMLYTALTNGVPAALLGVDASERIAIPSLLDTRFLRIDPNNESASFINGVIAQAVGGAPYSTMLRLYDGGAMILDGGADGDTRDMMLGLAKISPQIIANTIKAFDKDLRGVIDQSGREIIEVDKIGIGDILTNIMGFRTIEETSTQRKRGDFFRAKADVNERRNELLKDYRRARGGDRERLRETIKEFNKTVPPELQITEGTLARSVTAAAKSPDNKDDKALRRSLGLE